MTKDEAYTLYIAETFLIGQDTAGLVEFTQKDSTYQNADVRAFLDAKAESIQTELDGLTESFQVKKQLLQDTKQNYTQVEGV